MTLGRSPLRAGSAVLVLLLAACQSTSAPSATPGAAPSTAASAATTEAAITIGPPSPSPPEATIEPSSAPTKPPIVVFAPGTAIEVAVKDLNMRKKPTTSAKRLLTLQRHDILIVSPLDTGNFGWGPVKADGYTWYPVVRPEAYSTDLGLPALPASPIVDATPISGWVATDNGSAAFVGAVPSRCPTTVTLEMVSGMLPAERLDCFSGDVLTLTGTFGCDGCGGFALGVFKPAWLATPFEFDFLSVKPADRLGPIALRFPPDGPDRPVVGSIIQVRVHVDDSRATKCSITEGDGLVADMVVDPRTAVLYCRERLVVDSYDVLGVDPTFP